MYPEIMVIPMREELTRVGAEELTTAEAVDAAVKQNSQSDETLLLVVNSICGCAAGRMRPGVHLALENASRPDRVATVFAGQDREATARAREYFAGYPPSSPSLGLFRGGELVYFMQRGDIESRSAHEIAERLSAAFDRFCGKPTASNN
jgi:putative YphP/YqiW family bacilliredoxin